jgi:GT2 family glycosyltransferase
MASGVAVVIVNWNSGQLLSQCLHALISQTTKIDSIVVVDNASSDDSLAAVESRYPQVKIIRLNRNTGFAAANNHAVSGLNNVAWIALLNPDAFPDADWLVRLLNAARQHPEYQCFASRMLLEEDSGRLDGTGDVYHVSGQVWRRHRGQKAESTDLKIDEVFAPCAAAALYRRDVLLEVGGFDESYFAYLEDVDLGFRLRLAGYRCLYVPGAIVRHVGSATTGGQHSDFSVYHGHRNLVWTYFKNMPWSLFWLYLPQHLLLNVASLLWFSWQGQVRVIWKAKWDAIKGLPEVLRKRRKIQATRRVNAWELGRVMAKGWLTPYLGRRA